MELKPRPKYLQQLIDAIDTNLIKVLVGMRRCGKSSILQLFADYLRDEGVPESKIIHMNFEAAENLEIRKYEDLLDQVQARIRYKSSKGTTYLLFDEIQLIEEWEKAINALRLRDDIQIYITGSNAYMLSSQLATLLSGRYIEINVYPLSFAEFITFTSSDPHDALTLQRYMTYGGLPPVVEQANNTSLARVVLSGIYDTVFVKDVAQYVQIRNQTVFSDIISYLADITGSNVSISNISRRLESARRKTSTETIERYIQATVDAFLFYRARRFNLRGGSFLQGLDKYYPSDLGIRNMLLGFPERDFGHTLENLVHNELVMAGYEVRVGKIGDLEVDFVATKSGDKLFVQVCASLLEETTRKRELASLHKLQNEDGKKLVVTYDSVGLGNEGTIEIVNIIDWLKTL